MLNNNYTLIYSRISSRYNSSRLTSALFNNHSFFYNTVLRSVSTSSTQETVNVAETVVENFDESSSDNSNKNSDLISYKEVISLENLNKALKRTKSNSAPGLDGDVKAN
jgi:hypothetical protein